MTLEQKKTNKKERGDEGQIKVSQTVDGEKEIVFWGTAAVLAIKHEGDYCVGEFA